MSSGRTVCRKRTWRHWTRPRLSQRVGTVTRPDRPASRTSSPCSSRPSGSPMSTSCGPPCRTRTPPARFGDRVATLVDGGREVEHDHQASEIRSLKRRTTSWRRNATRRGIGRRNVRLDERRRFAASISTSPWMAWERIDQPGRAHRCGAGSPAVVPGDRRWLVRGSYPRPAARRAAAASHRSGRVWARGSGAPNPSTLT